MSVKTSPIIQQSTAEDSMSMFGGAAAFLGIAIVAVISGYTELAAMSMNIAWILFLFGLVFAALFSGYRQPARRGSGEGPRH